MPPFSSTGGDLVDQLRDWFDRQRERIAGVGQGNRPRPTERRIVRRTSGRAQAVPLGGAKPPGAGRSGRAVRPGRNDRAARGAYTLILGAVLIVGVVALFFAVSWALGTSSSSGPSSTPGPSASTTPLPNPAPISSPPPFPSPSPSPSPTTGTALPPPQPRTHVVEGGDTLNRIAQRYGVTVEAIMQANGFNDRNRILRIGERLLIPDTPTGSPAPVPR